VSHLENKNYEKPEKNEPILLKNGHKTVVRRVYHFLLDIDTWDIFDQVGSRLMIKPCKKMDNSLYRGWREVSRRDF